MTKDGTAKLSTTMYKNEKRVKKEWNSNIYKYVQRRTVRIFTAIYTLRVRQKHKRKERQQETNQSE